MGDSGSSFPVSFVLLSQILLGAGTMLFLSSGGPYVEDVVMPDELPVLFGNGMKYILLLAWKTFNNPKNSFMVTSNNPIVENDGTLCWICLWFRVFGIFY